MSALYIYTQYKLAKHDFQKQINVGSISFNFYRMTTIALTTIVGLILLGLLEVGALLTTTARPGVGWISKK